MELALADLTGCLYCVKLVRGAYMEQERERAAESGYEDPIWPDKEATDDCYNRLVDFLLHEKAQRPPSTAIHMMIASHNEDTIRLATERWVWFVYNAVNASIVLCLQNEALRHSKFRQRGGVWAAPGHVRSCHFPSWYVDNLCYSIIRIDVTCKCYCLSGQAGYGAYKYMPYGPVQEVLPYLSRRANENRGIFKGARREREVVGHEMTRRLQFWNNW